MKGKPPDQLLPLVESFFRQYLEQVRGASPHTRRAYRDTLRMFFEFLASRHRGCLDRLSLAEMTVERVMQFLDHLEAARHNQATTRNCRLAALRCFCRHLLRRDPARAGQYQRILALPVKRTRVAPPNYLEPEEVHRVLRPIKTGTTSGLRDCLLVLFLYNTGARISEALQVRWTDLQLQIPRQVRLHGKGSRDRICPLWADTARLLRQLQNRCPSPAEGFVFLNARGQRLTRDGAAYVLQRHFKLAQPHHSQSRLRKLTPHMLRHSCAVALLQAGLDLTVIRDYLGHSSIATTGRYLQTNLEMKRQTLEAFWKRAGLEPDRIRPWRPSSKMLKFLQSL